MNRKPSHRSHRSRSRRRQQQGPRFRRLVAEQLEQRQLLAGLESGGVVADTPSYDPDSIIVRFRDDVAPDQFRMGPTIRSLPFTGEMGAPYEVLPGLRRLTLPTHLTVTDALQLLHDHESVLYAEPNYRLQAADLPDDPRFDELWGLNNEGQTGGTYDVDIDAVEAWDVTVGSGNTIIAVIDTGVDYRHADLAANMWVNSGEIPGDGIDNDLNGFVDDIHGYDFANNDADPLDDQGHGTHVAGTVAAVGNNGIGVTGINWNAQIMALKFLDSSGSGDTDDAIKAIDYAVANGATISNNSWGYNGSFSQALYDAVKAARDADHVFVAAAGNGNIIGWGQDNDSNPFWPSNFNLDNVVAVAAVDHNDSKPLFSNYGATTVDLAAPGVSILSTVPNNGYGLNSGTSMASPHVAGVIGLVRDLHPDWAYGQVIHQVLQSVDPISSMEGITVTGGRLNAAAAVGVVIEPAPEIQVLLGSENLVAGTSVVDFGTTPPGLDQELTFTIKNRGVLPLHLTEPISVPGGYEVADSFGTTTVEVGKTTTFTLRLDGQTLGTYGGQVSFANDDLDENPFSFDVIGTVAIPPAVSIVDNGDATFETQGQWTQWTGQGYQSDIHESLAGSGQDVARWTFQRLLPGTYRVAATWTAYTNRATNAPFTVKEGEQVLGTSLVNQQLAPLGFSDDGAVWQELDSVVTIAGYELSVELADNANGRLNADAIRIERLEAAPDVLVRLGEQEIVSDVTTVSVGSTTVGMPLQRTFTVQNVGGTPLLLDDVIQLPAGFTLISGFSDTTLDTDQIATFTLQLSGDVAGDYSGQIRFTSNDLDESPFSFVVQGTVEYPPAVQILDNGDEDFSTVGSWTCWTGQGYENDIHESLAGAGENVATWQFNNLLPGSYRVAATWTAYTNRASNAPYDVLVDGVLADTQSINQRVVPNDFADAGSNWEWLGGTFTVSNELIVQLNNAGDGRVNADAIRLERLPNAPDISLSAGAHLLESGSTFDFGNTPPQAPLTQLFVVSNVGNESLVLQDTIAVSGPFQLLTGLGQTTLAPGAETIFAIQFDALELGTATGTVTLLSNDTDENPFSFTVQGTVAVPPAVQIIDDGDASFVVSGEWTRWTGQGYANDIDESLPGNGTDTATWSFTGLLPGLYRVAATWSHFTNRASNAPFTILDDNVPLTTVYVNQRLAPADFVAGNANWQQLGSTHEVSSGTLRVTLDDSGDGRANADAIRIERLDPVPEVQVTLSGADLLDGAGQVSFGSSGLNTPVPLTFVVTNRGGAALQLNEPISVPAGFSVVSSFSDTTLGTDESASFVVQLDAAAVGTWSGVLSFANNDQDENPFDIPVTGTVLAPPAVLIVDNGDSGFTTVGEWRRWTGQGYLSDIHESVAGSGADVASWTFTNLLPGHLPRVGDLDHLHQPGLRLALHDPGRDRQPGNHRRQSARRTERVCQRRSLLGFAGGYLGNHQRYAGRTAVGRRQRTGQRRCHPDRAAGVAGPVPIDSCPWHSRCCCLFMTDPLAG